MLQERPVEPDGWKNKLDRLDNLPGEPWVDKNAAWDKLYTRLHQKRRRKAGPWWLAAAVFLLFVAGASLFILHTHEARVGRDGESATPDSAGKIKKDRQVVINIAPEQKAAIGPVQPSPAETAHVIKNKPAGNGRYWVMRRPHAEGGIPSLLSHKAADTTVSLQTPVIPVPAHTPLLVQAAEQPKKKLRVVHINELNNPVHDDTQWTNNPSYSPNRFFRLLLMNTETSSSAAAEKQAPATDRFTIKTPIKN